MDGSQIIEAGASEITGLALLRQPFDARHISKLPKPTRKQTDEVKADFRKGIRCQICGGWHHKDVVHLDYVGHAALTDRLLQCDPMWNWEPVATTEFGTPALDGNGGMWIKLTVCDVTRLGYGHADGKKGGDAVKEVIGDALRNAAMRFGAALDLWHKGELHFDEDQAPDAPPAKDRPSQSKPDNEPDPKAAAKTILANVERITDAAACNVAAVSTAHETLWESLSAAQVKYVTEQISQRAGTLSQAPIDLDDTVPF